MTPPITKMYLVLGINTLKKEAQMIEPLFISLQ